METTQHRCDAWRNSAAVWVLLVVVAALLLAAFYHTIGDMMYRWDTKKEYGYSYMIPFITVFLLWQRKDEFQTTEFTPSWVGVGVLAGAIFLLMLGLLATTYTLAQYALVLAIWAIALAYMGWRGFKIAFAPLFLLFFMVPLPPFLFNNLSAELQLISSQLGVAVIRLFNISVYLSGNVIDLGVFKLQVAQACSGLALPVPADQPVFHRRLLVQGRILEAGRRLSVQRPFDHSDEQLPHRDDRRAGGVLGYRPGGGLPARV